MTSSALTRRRIAVMCGARRYPWQGRCIESLQAIPGVEVKIVNDASSRDALSGFRPDLMIDLDGSTYGSPSEGLPLGVWSFATRQHGTLDRLMPWREFAAGASTFDVALVTQDRAGTLRTIRSGRFKLSFENERFEDAMAICAQWPCLALEQFEKLPSVESLTRWEMRERATPGALFSMPLRLFTRLANGAMDRWIADYDWNIGIVENTAPERFLEPQYRPAIRWMQWADCSDVHADPMVAAIGGKEYILCESVDRQTNRGRIEAFERSGSAAVDLRCVMNSRTHLSYPYIFTHRGDYYCVPEMSQNGTVMLYKATSFPYEWQPVATLLDRFDACDATIFRFGSLWWLFCTSESFDPNLQLFAFYARELQGPWKPHRLNPIKTDITSARPAGTPFRTRGQLYRPAQDSSQTYGGAVCLNRILRLTPSEFEEIAVKTIRADHFAPYTAGTHTFSYAGSTCVIDAKKRRVSFKALPRLLARVWRRPYRQVMAHGA